MCTFDCETAYVEVKVGATTEKVAFINSLGELVPRQKGLNDIGVATDNIVRTVVGGYDPNTKRVIVAFSPDFCVAYGADVVEVLLTITGVEFDQVGPGTPPGSVCDPCLAP
jgi:hypothetical protein